jgi:hypothetical protein
LLYLNKPDHSIHIILKRKKMMCNVNIPRKDNSNLELTLEAGKTTIIIGANGSGKTRLAVYLEE